MPHNAKPPPLQTPSSQQAATQQQQVQQQESLQNQQQKNSTAAGSAVAALDSTSPSSANQSSEGRKISCEDIQLVQNLIERCLQLYMNQGEVINTLLNQAKIEPGFTSLVWQKLEEQNPDFFKAYYTRLKLKTHILTFNRLLDQQYQLMQKMRIIPTKPPMQSVPNVGQVPIGYPVPQLSMPPPAHAAPMSPLPPPVPRSPGALNSSTPMSENPSPVQDTALDPALSMLQCPTPGDMSSANGGSFPFGTDMSGIPLSLDTPFVSHEAQPQNGMVPLGTDEHIGHSRESLGTLGHLPRNFSLSDLAAELGHSDLEALGNYSSSPFMSPDAEAFLQSPDKDIIDDDKLLDDLDFGVLK